MLLEGRYLPIFTASSAVEWVAVNVLKESQFGMADKSRCRFEIATGTVPGKRGAGTQAAALSWKINVYFAHDSRSTMANLPIFFYILDQQYIFVSLYRWIADSV